MAAGHGKVERGLPVVGAGLAVGSGGEQEADGGLVAVLGGSVEGTPALLLGLVDVGAVLDKEFEDAEVSSGGGGVNGGDLHMVGGCEIDVGALINEVAGDLEVAEEGGECERSEAIGSVRVHVAAA